MSARKRQRDECTPRGAGEVLAAGSVTGPPVHPAAVYRRTAAATAAPRWLRTRLHAGAIELCRSALHALDVGDVASAADRLARARRIIEDLRSGLGSTDDEASRLAGLYKRVHGRLIEADYYRRREALVESITILRNARPSCRDTRAAPADALPTTSRCWIG